MPSPVRFPSGVSTAAKGSTLFNLPFPDPTKYITFFDDFNHVPVPAAADWTITDATAGTHVHTDIHGGALLMTAGGTENQGTQVQKIGEFWLPNKAKKFWLKTRLAINDADQTDFLIGMAVTDTTLLGSTAGDGVTDGVFFYKDDETANIGVSVQKDATTGQLTNTNIGTAVDDTMISLGLEYDGARYVKVFVDDVHKATMDLGTTPETYLPDTELTMSLAMLTGEGTANTVTVDYVFFAAER